MIFQNDVYLGEHQISINIAEFVVRPIICLNMSTQRIKGISTEYAFHSLKILKRIEKENVQHFSCPPKINCGVSKSVIDSL